MKINILGIVCRTLTKAQRIEKLFGYSFLTTKLSSHLSYRSQLTVNNDNNKSGDVYCVDLPNRKTNNDELLIAVFRCNQRHT